MMKDLPSHWATKTLGEVCDTGAGGTPLKSKSSFYENGTIPWLLSGEVCKKDIISSKNFITEEGLKCSSAKLFPKGSVLVAMYGATAGQVGILQFECSTNQAVCAIFPNKKLIAEYIYYYFLLFKPKLVAQAVGGAQPNISQEKIRNTPIPLPPLEEQKAIVKVLDNAFARLDKALASAEEARQLSQELWQSALNKALSPKDGWATKTLGEVCEIKTGSTPLKTEPLFWQKGTIPWFTINDIRKQGQVINYTQQSITELALKKTNVTLLPKGTVLLCCTASVGEVALTRIELTTNQQFNGLIIKDIKKMIPEFLFYYATTLKKHLLYISGKTTIDFISLQKVKAIPIFIPPLEEQKAIVAQLDVLHAKIKKLDNDYQNKIEMIKTLKASLLNHAFTGKLTLER